MSKRAEQRGLEALPPRWRKTIDGKGKIDSALPVRKFYIRAYEQAEKDIKDALLEWAKERYTGMDITKRDMWDGGYNCAMKQLIDKINSL